MAVPGAPSPLPAANRPVASDTAMSAAECCRRLQPSVGAGSGLPVLASRSRRSSSSTASSPWPWMNCIT